jgi:hypothetical protein
MKAVDKYHKWVEWSQEDQTYIGRCPDVITGIHGDDPIKLYVELHEVVQEVLDYLQANNKPLPPIMTKPMREIA